MPVDERDENLRWLRVVDATADLDERMELDWIPRMLGGASRVRKEGFAWWMYIYHWNRDRLNEIIEYATHDAELARRARIIDAKLAAAETHLLATMLSADLEGYYWSILAECADICVEVEKGAGGTSLFFSLIAKNIGTPPVRNLRCMFATWRVLSLRIEEARFRGEIADSLKEARSLRASDHPSAN